MASCITKLSCVFLLVCLCVTCIHAFPRRPRQRKTGYPPKFIPPKFVPPKHVRCPAGWQPLAKRPNNTCFYVSPMRGSWINAGQWCKLLGGRLAVTDRFDLVDILPEIRRMKMSSKPTGKYWLDAVLVGDPFNFVSLHSDRTIPQLIQNSVYFKPAPDKNCAVMLEIGSFERESCNSDNHFICEKVV